MDAMPVTVGQEFDSYRCRVKLALKRFLVATQRAAELPLGGTTPD